jgi:hypothetical protein
LLLSLACLGLALLSQARLTAADGEQVLEDTVADPSGNLLPGVRVALTRAKAVTHTDGNGRFSLTFRLAQPAAKDKDSAYDHLELDNEGYEGRVIKIEDLALGVSI